jgi:DNA-binding protein HU-beta
MNKSELIDAIAADAGITKAAKLALESGNVSGTLKTGGRVSLVGFGSWSVSEGETVEILKQEKRFK